MEATSESGLHQPKHDKVELHHPIRFACFMATFFYTQPLCFEKIED